MPFLCLKDVTDACAVGIKATLETTFADMEVSDYKDRLVFCVWIVLL